MVAIEAFKEVRTPTLIATHTEHSSYSMRPFYFHLSVLFLLFTLSVSLYARLLFEYCAHNAVLYVWVCTNVEWIECVFGSTYLFLFSITATRVLPLLIIYFVTGIWRFKLYCRYWERKSYVQVSKKSIIGDH